MLFTSAVTGQSNYLSFGFTTLSAENCFIITKEAMSTAQDLTITQDERRKYACQVYVNMLRSGNHPISFVLTIGKSQLPTVTILGFSIRVHDDYSQKTRLNYYM